MARHGADVLSAFLLNAPPSCAFRVCVAAAAAEVSLISLNRVKISISSCNFTSCLPDRIRKTRHVKTTSY